MDQDENKKNIKGPLRISIDETKLLWTRLFGVAALTFRPLIAVALSLSQVPFPGLGLQVPTIFFPQVSRVSKFSILQNESI